MKYIKVKSEVHKGSAKTNFWKYLCKFVQPEKNFSWDICYLFKMKSGFVA
jgi:hypothetical protein